MVGQLPHGPVDGHREQRRSTVRFGCGHQLLRSQEIIESGVDPSAGASCLGASMIVL